MKRLLPLIIVASSISLSLSSLAPKPFPSSQHVTVTNSIKPEMLEYKFQNFWIKKVFRPDLFTLKVNGKLLPPGSSLSLPVDNNSLTVRYDYSFANGFRTGAKEIMFTLTPSQKKYELGFSWDNEWRVNATGAKPQHAKRLKYNA